MDKEIPIREVHSKHFHLCNSINGFESFCRLGFEALGFRRYCCLRRGRGQGSGSGPRQGGKGIR